MSGSEDMIAILVGERDRALREVMALERERDAARAEIAHLRRGIEAYRATTPCHSEQCGWPECPSCLWEREDAERNERP